MPLRYTAAQKLLYPMGNRGIFGAGGAAGRAPYTGLVATHAYVPTGVNTSNKQIMTRTRHRSRGAITSLQLVFPGFLMNGSGDTGLGGTATLTASIEYPVGTFSQVQFSASTSGTVPNGGVLVSDARTVSIPDNTDFFVRNYWSSATGILYVGGGITDTNNGEASAFGASGIADQTMGGTITDSGGNYGYYPCAIIGTTTKPSIMFFGDSITHGAGDTMQVGDPPDRGLTRGLGASFGYINAGAPGAQASDISGGAATQRTALLTYCTHLICAYGINDLDSSVTPAALLTRLQAIWALKPGAAYQTTITPHTDSGNTTPQASNANRVTFNNMIRAGQTGMAGYLEVADQVELTRDQGTWKSSAYTADGLHPSRTGYLAAGAAFNPANFT